MTRKFVTLHDEEWIKKNCVLSYDPTVRERVWVPKAYNYMHPYFVSVLQNDNGCRTGMYRALVGKTIEVKQQKFPREPRMDGYGFCCAEGAPYSIPTWLIKAYWEVTE